MVKRELRVTRYELLVKSWKLKSSSWNSIVRVQIHEFKFRSYEFNFTSYEFNLYIWTRNSQVVTRVLLFHRNTQNIFLKCLTFIGNITIDISPYQTNIHIDISHIICSANQLTSFDMNVTLRETALQRWY